MFMFTYKPHGTSKPNIYNRYTHKKRKKLKHNIKDGYQIIREERK